MTTIGKSCSEVIDFVKKVEGLRKVGQANVLDKRPKSTSNFLNYHSRGLGTLAITVQFSAVSYACFYRGLFWETLHQTIIYDGQEASSTLGTRYFLDRNFYNYGDQDM